MSVSMTFAFRVRDLNRRGLNVAAIARNLNVTEHDVMEVHRMLYLPINAADEPVNERSDAEHVAAMERMPKRMQDRIQRSRG